MQTDHCSFLSAKTLACLAGVLLSLALVGPAYADYPGQHNESAATAYPIGAGTFAASLQTTNDADFYSFYATVPNQQIHVSFTNTTSLSNADAQGEAIDLLDSQETLLAQTSDVGFQNQGPGQTGSLSFSVPDPGKYYLLAGAAPGNQVVPPSSYSFTLSSPSTISRTAPGAQVSTCTAQYGAVAHAQQLLAHAKFLEKKHRSLAHRRLVANDRSLLKAARSRLRQCTG